MSNTSIADALRASAARIGADPLDYATVISYETGGTFNPGVRGGAGNRHIGLIQFGPNEQRAYGANQSQSFADQLPAVERYLMDRGFKRGMGRLDLYSTINAGRPGLYGASDAGNGGAPGTVMDKVTQQMGAHERKAAAFLGGSFAPTATGYRAAPGLFTEPAAGQTPQARTALADALPGATLPTLAPILPTSPLADAFAPNPVADAARQRRQQTEEQRRQALLSVNAFAR